ncbi:hypothetical protein KC957_00195, partial [Candidatus Saccharibacteria bacterium]|nr:hypothetical protein [Candidatus Saccharibacteria bacterium]
TRSNFTVPGDIAANTVALTPTGRVYVLSKQSGNLDVVKVNLDGSDRQVVVKATGREEVNNTEIYATNDWQFVVLKARRDGVQAALYLLDTSTDKLTDLDTAAVDFNIAGWHDHQFVYSTYDSKRQPWNPKQQELKVFDADSGQRTMLLSTAAQGNSYDNYLAQSLAGVFFVGDKLVYGVQWSGSGPDLSKQFATIQEVSLPSLTARELRKDKGASLIMSRATPTAVNVQITTDKPDSYQYLNGNLTEINMSTEELLRAVPSYIPGPANQYLWDELVDGASQVYVAEGSLQTKHVVMPAGEFHAFGWYGGDYVLLGKNGSELFIIPTDSTTQTVPQKVVDYHRPPGQGI